MRVTDNLSVSLRNLLKRKIRTLLTVIGVTVGTASIVVMISLGLGINRSFQEGLKNMSDITKIEIYHNPGDKGIVVTDDMVDRISKLEGVQAATPVLQTYINAVAGKRTGTLQIYGIRPEAMAAMNYPVASGRLLGEGEWEIVYGSNSPNELKTARERADQERQWRSQQGAVVMSDGGSSPGNAYSYDILDEKVQGSVDWAFGQPSANGAAEDGVAEPGDETTSGAKPVKPYNLAGVGILSGDSWEFAYQNYMNINTVKRIVEDRQKFEQSGRPGGGGQQRKDTGYSNLIVKALDIKYVEDLVTELTDMGFSYVWSPISYIVEMRKMSSSLQGLLGAIGAVALFVAAIGIANTMIMSIYERTREIGVMKVIGASLKDIRNMFLTESAAIGLIGGVFGAGLSYGVSYLFKRFPNLLAFLQSYNASGTGVSTYIPLWLTGAALLFATCVGLLSGYLPARRAMRISALTAIQTQS
jgi:ABC-type antimicrobial peptide transport system permease subunit